jgi:hypothetical protein
MKLGQRDFLHFAGVAPLARLGKSP